MLHLPRSVSRTAPAKLNLTLEIVGKREDGYHEIRSVFRALALHDTLHFVSAQQIDVQCSQPELNGSENLAYRAAICLAQATGFSAGAKISIKKDIPVAAGLGGGSSDAAATLLGLNELWATEAQISVLHRLASELGSDVPFFLLGGTAVASGRGEILTSIAELPQCPVVLVKPPVSVSTALIYKMVTYRAYGEGALTQQLVTTAPDTAPEKWPLGNALQQFTCQAFPVVRDVLEALTDAGALQAHMCGSGPTCFGLFASTALAHVAADRARQLGWSAWVTQFA